MRLKQLLRFMAVSAFVCGCSAAGITPAPPSRPSTVSPLPSPVTPVAARDLVVDYERSGGIAGQTSRWTLYGDGRIVNGAGTVTRADTAKLAALQAAVELVLARGTTSPASRPCPDCFKYTITLQASGKTVNLATYEATANPPELDALLKAIGDLTR